MARVSIVGSGNLGANTAFFLAEKGVADAVLYDVKDGLAKGKSLDLMQAAPLRGYRVWVHAATKVDEVRGADVTVIAAGTPRKPGQKRDELFDANAPLVASWARELAGSEGTVLIATEPVDALTTLFLQESHWPANRVLGIGAALDAARLRYLIAHKLRIVSTDVQVTVYGRHGNEIVVDFDRCSVSGIPVNLLLGKADLIAIQRELVGAGDAIVALAQRNSSYYAPSAVAADIAEAIIKNTGGIFPVSHGGDFLPGLTGVALSMPAILGKNGVEQSLVPPMDPDIQARIRQSAEQIKADLARFAQGGAA